MNTMSWQRWAAATLCWLAVYPSATRAEEPLPIELPAAGREVDFTADVMPLLKRNCLACHNASTAEGDVVLETVEQLRAARDGGPLVVSGDAAASRLLAVAAHRAEPLMPPEDNDVGANPLTPPELGLLQRWIEQGAKDSQAPAAERPIEWQPVPNVQRTILAAAIARDGDIAVCSRGNELAVYNIQPAELLANLVDPALQPAQVGPRGAADVDQIRAVAIHADTGWIASAGFRTVKLWQRYQPSRAVTTTMQTPQAAVLAPTGQHLAVAGEDGSVHIVDLRGETPNVSWSAHDKPIVGLDFAQAGRVLVTATADGVVRAWRAADGAALAAWQLAVPARRIALAADDLLVTSADDLVLRTWPLAIPADPPAGGLPAAPTPLQPARTITGHGRRIEALAALPNAPRQFLSGSVDGTVRRWNAEDGTQTGVWIHGDAVLAIDVQADGARFVSIGADRAAKAWNTAGGDAVATMHGDYRSARRVAHLGRLAEIAEANEKDAQAAVATVEKQLATDQETKKQADAALDKAQQTLAEKTAARDAGVAKHDAAAKALEALQEQRTRAEQSLAAANARPGQSEKELELLQAAVKRIEAPEELAAATAALDAVRQDRQAYLQTVIRDAQAALDALTKQRDEAQTALGTVAKERDELQMAFDTAMATKNDADATVARVDEAISRASEAVAAARQSAEACTAKLAAQQKLQAELAEQAQLASPAFTRVSFAPDGKRLLLADDRGRMFVYDAQSFAPVAAWEGPTAPPVAALLADGKHAVVLASTAPGDGQLTEWSVLPAWRLAHTIGDAADPHTLVDRVLSLDFSPDGALLAAGGGVASRSGEISLWSVADGALVRSLDQPHSDTVFGLDFSPNGEFLASASADRTMKVFRVADGGLAHTFEGHTDHVIDVSWRANGKQLASCSADHKIKVWDFALGEQRRTIDVGSKEVTGIVFFGTGGQLVSSSGDRNVRIHNADDGSVVRTLAGAADYLYCCAAAETGSVIVAGGADRVLRVWNGADGAVLGSFESPQN